MITACKHCKRMITNERYDNYDVYEGHPLQWVEVEPRSGNCQCHCVENQGINTVKNGGSDGLHKPVDPLAYLVHSSLPEESGSSKAASGNRPT